MELSWITTLANNEGYLLSASLCWSYTVCHGFRLTKRDDHFWIDFDHFKIEQYFWRQLGQY
jgi:hypothetical protein